MVDGEDGEALDDELESEEEIDNFSEFLKLYTGAYIKKKIKERRKEEKKKKKRKRKERG